MCALVIFFLLCEIYNDISLETDRSIRAVLAIVSVQWLWANSTEMGPSFDLPGEVNFEVEILADQLIVCKKALQSLVNWDIAKARHFGKIGLAAND